ncbi:tRNA lysidine(34) synthetase TilS [Falsirhodobacter sp. 20TX0035]|uniref:tRNA lysidine(34) synthetase TilS n=1 Tax=Falsirhodobacter sp. 20TX0035 TaxID=3022019 RepID=UPI00232FE3A5|nr:tRNA lysidine(34) synthetase TilS [Falsirhodobacter sp. 20TX0035]MDB6453880.1 tRNA lysidine(34) synthetase TilS [Falsirhodobacter sp. 20TX0035]
MPPVLGLAVSGGGDSVALLLLAAEAGIPCRAVTVDHGLRPEAAEEARQVADLCARLQVPHQVLRWQWDGRGNLPDAARRARRRLMAGWARDQGIGTIALGHTRDDVAETFLMRLARGAGLDGLSAMSPAWEEHGLHWRRPLLSVGREELRDLLRARRVRWAEDPTNTDTTYERARARQALGDLPLGLTRDRLAEVAQHLAKARAALDAATDTAARHHLQQDRGDVLLNPEGLDPEMRRRLLLRAVAWVGRQPYAPRAVSVARAMDALTNGRPAAVQGCGMVAQNGAWRIYREWAAVRGFCTPATDPWDGWRLDGPAHPDLHIAALGEAVARCPTWRNSGLPRRSLLASPAVWRGETLVAAPLAGLGSWTARREPPLIGLNPPRE